MLDETAKNSSDEGGDSPGDQSNPARVPAWRRLLSVKWLIVLVVASAVLHGIGYTYFRLTDHSAPDSIAAEVDLGTYEFEAEAGEIGRIARAEFALHIALLDQVDQPARDRLETHRFRVQQDVEELLRTAHSGDFDDPALGELKRRLQEQINETLGMRVISDVIITDLKLERSGKDLGLVTDRPVPWVEKPSS